MMVNPKDENKALERNREFEKRIQEVNVRLSCLLADVDERLRQSEKQELQPGLVFIASAPPADYEGEQETAPSFMLLQHEGNGLWICCKLSVEITNLGPFDILIDSDEWTGGFPVLLEAWNTVILHADDIKKTFFEKINSRWVDMARKLFHTYQRDGVIPEDLLELTGSPLKEDDFRWAFRLEEMAVMERARMHYHEGWKLADVVDAMKTWINDRVCEIRASVSLRRPALQAATVEPALELKQKWHTPLLPPGEDVLFAVVISQERDLVYLRVYPQTEGMKPDGVIIQKEEAPLEDRGTCIQVPLGKSELLPDDLDIEIRAGDKRFLFLVSFQRDSRE